MARTAESLSAVKVNNALCKMIGFIYQIRTNCQGGTERETGGHDSV